MKIFFKKLILVSVIFISQYGYGQISRQWVATYNGQGDFNDHFTCMQTDGSGNIYLAGSTVNPDQGKDYLIIKMDASGNVLWNKQFAGSANGPDEVNAIAVDNAGFVYVTGYFKQLITGTDYYTIKMNSVGDTVWTATYNNPTANGFDQANDLFVDGNGNVFVTGQSDSDPTSAINDDYLTVKYNSSGSQVWATRYNGTGNAIDKPIRVMVDVTGNVFVTGRSDNGSNDDYLTIKYNSSGTSQWVVAGNRGGRDRATGMAMDISGNVYVTGRSSNGGNDDFWTVKYTTSGAIGWQTAYDFVDNDRATAIAIDSGGNVYVTGQSDSDPTTTTNWDYETVMYNTAGAQVWQKRYNGVISQYDIPNSVSVSSSGNVYVTGVSDADASTLTVNDIVTVSYAASTGTQNWISTFNGTAGRNDSAAVVLATPNGCFVAGNSANAQGMMDALLLSYSSIGTQQLNLLFNGIGNNNENIHSMVVDNANNVYAAGYIVENESDRNIAVMKFNSSGSFVCKETLNGTVTGSSDDAAGIALDNLGNPFITGYIDNSGTSNDIQYFKINPATCDTQWTRLYNGTANGSDKIYDMTKDSNGNFYLTGKVDMDPTFAANPDCFTAKIGTTGNIIWSHTYNNSGINEDRGSFIIVAPSGNVYVAGRTFNGTNFDILIICYNNAGTQLWAHTYDGGFGLDLPSGLTLGTGENIFICGRTETSTPGVFDFLTLKFNSAGTQQWAIPYNGSGNGDDEAQSIAFNGFYGGPVVTGKSDSDPSLNENMDMITLQYDSTGIQVWLNSFAGIAGSDDIPDNVAVNASYQIYLTGHTNKASILQPNYDIYTTVLNHMDGSSLWSDTYNGPSDSSDIGNLIYLNGADFYVAGSTFETGQQRNTLIIKYSGTVDGLSQANTKNGIVVYPNPADNFLHINLNNIQSTHTLIQVYDAIGKEIISRSLLPNADNLLDINSLESGIFHYLISNQNEIISSGKFSHIK